MSQAAQIYHAAFQKPRTPRSEPYKRGVRAALERLIDGGPEISRVRPAEYQPGTVEFDAWLAGVEEGHMRARHYLQRQTSTAQ